MKQRHDAGSCGRLISEVIACYEAHFLCYEADDFDLDYYYFFFLGDNSVPFAGAVCRIAPRNGGMDRSIESGRQQRILRCKQQFCSLLRSSNLEGTWLISYVE